MANITSQLSVTEHVRRAQSLLAKAITDKEVNTFVSGYVGMKDEIKQTAVWVYTRLEKLYPQNAMDGWPVPGSAEGNNPDKYKAIDIEGKTKASSFYTDAAKLFDEGKACVARLELIRQALQVPPTGELASWGKPRLSAEKKMYDGRLTAAKALLVKAVNLHMQMSKMKGLTKVVAEIRYDDDGLPARTNYPITIASTLTDKGERGKVRDMTIDEFLHLDLDAGLKAGGTFEAVLANVKSKKPTVQGKTQTRKQIALAWTRESFFEQVDMVNHWLEDAAHSKEMLRLLDLKNKSDTADDDLERIGDLNDNLDRFWTDDLEKKYQSLKKAKTLAGGKADDDGDDDADEDDEDSEAAA